MNLASVTMNWGDILIASAIGIVIVFIALTILVFAFKLTGNLSVRNSKKRMEKQGMIKQDVDSLEIPASEIAAISMALSLYFEDEQHDKESNVITIKRIERRYSPWNSKIYGLNNL